jgi:hypothetical protein
MARSDYDYRKFAGLERELSRVNSPANVITNVYTLIFGDAHPPKPEQLIAPNTWDASTLARIVRLIGSIVSHYVSLFQDPRDLPVTHYWKQKKVAIFLDQQFGLFLNEALARSGGEVAQDDFLDKPILFLKQEARRGGFPRVKKRASLKAIEERFCQKLEDKGVRLENIELHDFHSLSE